MMGRGIGGVEALAGLPEILVLILIAITWLGSVAFSLVATSLVYWFGARRGGAFALGASLSAVALTIGLKAAFAAPRPPLDGRLVAATGFGFPSGHALVATVTWGALAVILDAGSRRARFAVAALVVGLVCLSRVALGVHYTVDVIAGAAAGLGLLLVLLWAGRDPAVALGGAVVLAGAAALVAGASTDSTVTLGAAAGGFLAWRTVEVPARPWGRGEFAPAAAGVVVLGGLAAAAPHLGTVGALVGAIVVAGVISLPTLEARRAA